MDLETRSAEDLNAYGVYKYVEHPSTQILICAWCIDAEPVYCWNIFRGEKMPAELRAAILDPETVFTAHNADFEHALFTVTAKRHNLIDDAVWNELRQPERWSCTANRAGAMGLPRALDKVAKALNLQHQKDVDEGKQVMLAMCKPCGTDEQGNLLWIENDTALQKLIDYCIADVEAEREADLVLPELSEFEREVAAATTDMNIEGIRVDVDFLEKMRLLAREVLNDLNLRIFRKSGGQVPKVTNPQAILRWMKAHYDLDYNSLGKWVLNELVEDKGIDPLIREVLVLRRDGGKSSVAKLNAIGARINSDHVLRGSVVYRGAPATGRYCLAEGSLILVQTVEGTVQEKPIETVKIDDLVWDGDDWVAHEGVVFSGEKEVIEYDGVVATPDHIVYYTNDISVSLAEAKERELTLFRGNR